MNRICEGSDLPMPSRNPPTIGWDPYEVWRTRVRVQGTARDNAAPLQGPTDAQPGMSMRVSPARGPKSGVPA